MTATQSRQRIIAELRRIGITEWTAKQVALRLPGMWAERLAEELSELKMAEIHEL
jgi:hypothetical protein